MKTCTVLFMQIIILGMKTYC